MAAFDKGHEKLGGRQKGTGNKATVELKELPWATQNDSKLDRTFGQGIVFNYKIRSMYGKR